MTEWMPVVQAVGIPASLLFMLAYALAKIVPWIGTNFVLPVVARHVAFVDGVQKSLTDVSTEFKTTAVDMHIMAASLTKLAEAQTRLFEAQQTLTVQGQKAAEKVAAAADKTAAVVEKTAQVAENAAAKLDAK